MIYKSGNLFNSTVDVLCHQVNLYGVMGAGIAAEIREKFSDVNKAYEEYCKNANNNNEEILGQVLIVQKSKNSNQYIANCFCQNEYSTDGCLTNYEKMEECFESIKKWMGKNGKTEVGFPYKFGCGIAGGDWEIVEAIIENVFDEPGIIVEIWKL